MPPAPVRTDELLVQAASRGEVDRVRALLDHGAVAAGRNHYLLTAEGKAATGAVDDDSDGAGFAYPTVRLKFDGSVTLPQCYSPE